MVIDIPGVDHLTSRQATLVASPSWLVPCRVCIQYSCLRVSHCHMSHDTSWLLVTVRGQLSHVCLLHSLRRCQVCPGVWLGLSNVDNGPY